MQFEDHSKTEVEVLTITKLTLYWVTKRDWAKNKFKFSLTSSFKFYNYYIWSCKHNTQYLLLIVATILVSVSYSSTYYIFDWYLN